MQPDECYMKAADKKADCEQPKALGLKCLLQRIFGALGALCAPGACDRRATFTQSEGERNHEHRNDPEDEHGRMPIVKLVLQDRGKRDDGELTEQPARGGK